MENEAIKTKVCSRCGRELPLTEFPKNAQSRDGHLGVCKECQRKRMNDYRRKLAEKARLYDMRGGSQGLHAPGSHARTQAQRIRRYSDIYGKENC